MVTKSLSIIGSIVLLLAVSVGGLFFWAKSGGLQKVLINQLSTKIEDQSISTGPTTTLNVQNALQQVLGFDSEKVYLFLFLNNTELRPGGGFIGVYAVVKVKNGIPEVVKVEGTEILDNNSSRDFISVPPDPIKEYLAIKRLEFRDSNWYADFASSSQKALELYKLENGIMNSKIDAVIGITPTVLEEIIRITGPIKIQDINFTADNFTKTLEYEVEYGFAKKGIAFNDRKQIMSALTKELVKKLSLDLFVNWGKYSELATKMINQKHIIAYAVNPEAQKILMIKNMDGRIKQTTSDYILWTDASLGALKTDASIKRELTYSFKPEKNGKYLASVKMKYIHNGVFDWRTTRYRTYVKLYTPKGSQYVSVAGSKDNKVETGQEFGKQFFSTFAVIEPQNTAVLEWKFYLSEEIVNQIKNGQYYLLAQKQIGTIDHKLILDLDFGKKVKSATPGEEAKYYNDNKFQYNTDLTVDRYFNISMK